jgi:CMP-N-acetylneuraminic acid synthetase
MLHRAGSKADHLLKPILGVIPARGGSKSIPRKNIARLAGRPLLTYTCEAALGSRFLSKVVLSTDDEEIAELGRQCGVEVPFLRPSELSRDDSSSLKVAQHAVRWLMMHAGWQADVVVLLQPTSPLRQSHHIDEAIDCFAEPDVDSVVSVTQVPHRYSPYAIMRLQDGNLQDFWKEPLPFDRFRRQDVPALYARNGPAVLACQREVLLGSNSFYGKKVVPYYMNEEDSIDIDTLFDLQLAEWLISKRLSRV